MADFSLLHTCIYLAAFVFVEISAAFSKPDNITNTKLIHELSEEKPMKNYSGKPSKMDVPWVFPLEVDVGDLSHSRPSGERLGKYPSTSAFGHGVEPTERTEYHIENSFSGFLTNQEGIIRSTAIQNSKNMSQASHRTTARPELEEILMEHPTLKVYPSSLDIFYPDINAKGINMADDSSDKNKLLSNNAIKESLEIENHIEHEKVQDLGKEFYSTVHPTVSTIALHKPTHTSFNIDQGSRVTQLQKLQIESGANYLNNAMQMNILEDQSSFHEQPLYGMSEGLKQTAGNNVPDSYVIPKGHDMEPSERYSAAYRTTEGYSALQLDSGPNGNEVVSADIELNHKNTKYQESENNIQEEVKAENKTEFHHFSPLRQDKQNVVDSPLRTGTQSLSQEASTQSLPLAPSLREALTTLWTFVNKTSPFSTFDQKSYFTLEAKSRIHTERLDPTPTYPKILKSENNDVATNGIFDILPSSLQPQETPTPAMQVLDKTLGKFQEASQNSSQPTKASLKPVTTQKAPVVSSAPPGLVVSTAWKMLVTRQQDVKVSPTVPPQLRDNVTPYVPINGTRRTGRRGEIRVTTQRAVQRPRMIEVPTSFPSKKPTADQPKCAQSGGTCEYLGSNKTLLKWEDLQRTLSFAWDMHVYGTGTLFVLLSIISMVNLIGSPIVCVSYLPYILASNALLFVIGILRSVFFLLDPYGTKSKISNGLALVLYNVTFPLMLSTFAILVLLVLKMASFNLLPPKLQTLPLLGVVAVIHFIILLSSDLLTHLLNPSVNIVLQMLSISWGIFLMISTFVAYYRLRASSKDTANETQRASPTSEDIVSMQTQERNIKCLFTSSRVLLVGSFFGLLCCGLQMYAVLWLYGLLGKKNEFSWSWWFLQFWFRIFELGLCFSMLFVSSHSFCQQCCRGDHTCWSKIISYFCPYNKAEVTEYPNNCYEWTNSIQERVVNNNISKSIIRNEPDSVPLRMLKENNDTKLGSILCNNSGNGSPLFKPKPDPLFGIKSQNAAIGRSYTSICFEKESMLSLTDLEFRPPSPINLSRSIDEALFREHLVRDSIFLDSSLQYPSYLTRQESCSSLKECSGLNQTVDPLISADLKMRRCSNPDYMYSLARCSSMTEADSPSESIQQSKELPRDMTTDAVASGSSIDSFSKGSIKISWNPWRHGLSSVESLPLEEAAPSSQLLKQASQPSIRSKGSELEKTFGKRLIERSHTTDSNSIASDTIEL
ncbi:hypothetical protein GDO86_007179 [Hymenochirus boettgeri]|uniref:Proline-rich transmembrane protein 3/4 domain-containing protein n=1 Tax=Hymenochirus boettgeri TaxID=247094 RepID=A0A8T2J0S6_9PIPI|nr:hypothetical protein GDO86_007179 [Hymenochirus boettgeri]